MSLILVVEDDASIGPGLVRALEGQGHSVDLAANGAQALHLAAIRQYELMVLDLGLPDIDGLDLCGQLRELVAGVRVLMLTARSQLIDVVAGLDAGADDYLAKPFRLPELLARTRAQLRSPQKEERRTDRSEVADLVIDRSARRVTKAGQEILLPPKEFELLSLFMAEEGRVLARERIMSEVWDAHWFGPTNTLDTHISTLRRRLDAAGGEGISITVIRGVGYRFEPA
ncbi:MAG: response regulator transcription factor [Actinomycetota bacterium]|nr:response regulator transcription factor [Actinomycetota bacterium]